MQHFHFRKGQKQPLAYVYGRLSVSTFALFFRHVFSKWLWRGPRRGVMRVAEGYGKVGRWIWAAGMGDEYGRWRRFRHGWRRFHFMFGTCATRLGWKAKKRCRSRLCFGTCAAQAGTCAVHTGTCAARAGTCAVHTGTCTARAGTCAVHTGTCTVRRPVAAAPPLPPAAKMAGKWRAGGGKGGGLGNGFIFVYICKNYKHHLYDYTRSSADCRCYHR